MYMFVGMTIHFLVNGFMLYTFLYECLSIFLKGFSLCTFLYGWLSISFWMLFCHVHFCTNNYYFLLNGLSSFTYVYEWLPFLFEWIVYFYISVQMTIISSWMDCRRLYFCTNDYHFFLTGLSSFTFLYKWLPFLFDWIVVIYIPVRMTTIYFWMDCRHIHFCTNDYHYLYIGFCHAHSVKWLSIFFVNVFTCVQCSSTRE